MYISSQKIISKHGFTMKKLLLLPFLFLAMGVMGQVRLQQVYTTHIYAEPIELTHANDSSGRAFVAYKNGIVRIFHPDAPTAVPPIYLNIASKTQSSGEQGLLGLAFHPDYKHNGYVYVNYVAQNPRRTVISRFTVMPNNPNKADSSNEFTVLTFLQPVATNHKGGKIAFGPNDGYLYIAQGDGGGGGDPARNGQRKKAFLGKILRIDVDHPEAPKNYGIPPTNPFVGDTSYFPEVYTYGMRNPWRFSFDKETNRLWCADVGQNAWEEVDTLVAGGNYGWPYQEGSHCYDNPPTHCADPGLLKPIYEYGHTGTRNCIVGGFVYHGPSASGMVGKYIFADNGSGQVWSMALRPDSAPLVAQIGVVANIGAFGEDQDGGLYAMNSSSGAIYKLVDNATSLKNKDLFKNVAIRVLPIPARSEVVVYLKGSSSCQNSLEIRDLDGKIVKKVTIPKADAEKAEIAVKVNVSDIAVGTYVVSQPCGGVAKSAKIVISR